VKDSVGVSHGVMCYLHTLSSPKLITGYAAVICYKMAVGSFSAKPAIIFRKMGKYFIEGAGDTGDRSRYNLVASTCHYRSLYQCHPVGQQEV